jgi:hypothetical protein
MSLNGDLLADAFSRGVTEELLDFEFIVAACTPQGDRVSSRERSRR